jgi:hypothetical protein
MELVPVLAAVTVALVILDLLALAHGAESRDGFGR